MVLNPRVELPGVFKPMRKKTVIIKKEVQTVDDVMPLSIEFSNKIGGVLGLGATSMSAKVQFSGH